MRELRNVLERSLVFAEGEVLAKEDLPSEIVFHVSSGDTVLLKPAHLFEGLHDGRDKNLRDMEVDHILRVLEKCSGNKKLAAEQLGISRSTLYEKLKQADDSSGHSEAF